MTIPTRLTDVIGVALLLAAVWGLSGPWWAAAALGVVLILLPFEEWPR